MLPITSLQNPTIKLIRSLDERKERRERGLFVAEGLAMLERALALDWKPEFLLATKPPMLWDDVKPLIVVDKVMAAISAQNNPHEVLAVFKTRYERGVTPSGVWLALEDIRDPGNLGTILRTAEAAGVTGVVLAGDCCDPYSPEAVRASTGSIFNSTIAHMPAVKLVDLIKGWPGDVVGTAMTASQDFRTPTRRQHSSSWGQKHADCRPPFQLPAKSWSAFRWPRASKASMWRRRQRSCFTKCSGPACKIYGQSLSRTKRALTQPRRVPPPS